ncbi:hypothetical protein HXX76_009864 [Chlamydomonas incerta]|uniref:Dynein axonemal heavy chain 7 n=1 Tax=Chlamydomonas incerta TaxID=51695 RepID=A0A835SS83_CHLIN|nr:hypothetical protein HXX76_009864 [Chlamydomonas incerta]|eukprot:KAG2430891.1 hypothetical protein HXX76_009864 [Chlamydomonas incerta]
MDWDDSSVAGTAKRPGPKQTLQSSKQVPAKVQVKLPKALFESALSSGNASLVERSVKAEASRPPPGSLPPGFKLPPKPPGLLATNGGSPGSPGLIGTATATHSLADLNVSASLMSVPTSRGPPLPTATPPVPRRVPTCEYYFDPGASSDVFPSRSVEGSSLADYFGAGAGGAGSPALEVQADPAHPLGWVPAEETQMGTRLRPRTGQLPVRTTTSMPLEYFDSPEMELVQPEERLRRAREAAEVEGRGAGAGPVGVPGFSRYFDTSGTFMWAPCVFTDYDRAQDMYHITWNTTGKTKWVKRLNLLFADENKSGFAFRLRQARRRRDESEGEARYSEYVSKQPFNNIDVLDEPFKRKIFKRVGGDVTQRMASNAHGHFEDFRANFKHAVKSAIVDVQFRQHDAAAHLAAANIQSVSHGSHAQVPPQGCVNLEALPPGRVVLVNQPEHAAAEGQDWFGQDVGREGFELLLADVKRGAVVGHPALLTALQQMYLELDISGMALTVTDMRELPLPARLGDYARMQRNHRELVADMLSSDWTIKVIAIVERILSGDDPEMTALAVAEATLAAGGVGGLGGGGAPPPHTNPFGLSQAAAMRFIKMVSLAMADQLRTAVLSSIQLCCDFWKQYDVQPGDGHIRAGYPSGEDAEGAGAGAGGEGPAVEPANVWFGRTHPPPAKWGEDLHASWPPPLLLVALQVVDGGVQLVPPLAEVEETVIQTYDDIIAATAKVDDISVKVVNMAMEQYLAAVDPADDPAAVAGRDLVRDIVQKNLVAPADLAASFQEFAWLVTASIDDYVAAWAEAGHSLAETDAEVGRLAALGEAVAAKAEGLVAFRLLAVDCSGAQSWLGDKAAALRRALLTWQADTWHAANVAAVEQFEAIVARLHQAPDSTEALDELDKFVERVDGRMPEFEGVVAESRAVADVLHGAQHELSMEAFETHWRLLRWPLDLAGELGEVRGQLARWRGRYLSQLKADSAALIADLAELQAEVERFVTLGDLKQVDDRTATVLDIENRLNSYAELTELYGNREEIFGLPRSEYPALEDIRKAFAPSSDLWKIASEFARSLPEWLDGPFTEIDAEAVAADVDRWWRSTAKLGKQLDKEPLEVVTAVRAKLEDFQVHLPLITALRNPGLRDRHWERISTAAGFPVRADAGFSLSRALQLGLPKHLAAIEEVAEYASKEYSLERALDKMQADWAGVVFETMAWRATGTTILRALDDVQMLLDDQIVKTQSMRASPYIGPFEDRVRLWEAKLGLVQETLDQWLRCQQGWLYLEPIFGSEDIMQQMPNEGRKFKAVDHTWRRTMEKLSKNAEVLVTCADDELLKALAEANKLLEQVTKGLNDYLETKRLAFPRFYFLSNDELLEILSETKDPTRVQPFLRKIFEGINALEFQPDGTVTAMSSEEGEKVPFKDTFNPRESQGQVERWLIECEIAMRTTLKDTILKSFNDYVRTPRINWVTSWPGQVVIAVDCMYWTKEVGEAIAKQALPDYSQQCTDELMKVVNKVRGKLSKLDRKTLSALIVIDVHARDVVAELAATGVTSEADFAWNSQLRYGWEGGEVSVRMINAQIYYGYEYLGNGSRLVITPLTDRCYRTLMGALHLNLGGAPEGPAGTGKTETTKDLAKAIAMQCVVFNCSDGLDYQAMGKFFKGLASSGAWACFDEFNRIDLEVLSVIAQQILTMQRAKSAGVSSFEFEGTKLSLRPTFSVFITMNPGYAGRSELPDNLKALFRSVAMMVPDYALISEIMLYSSGYLKARDLARKLVATYRLCSEQLSSQSHYDYGMRAVMSVLRAAAANKQRSPDTLEDVLMLRSIRDVNEPKFLAPDIPLFGGILSDLFPGVDLPATDYSALDERLVANCTRLNLQPTPTFLDKAHQLYEMILVRHGLMLVGYSYGAKTCIYRTLAGALADLETAGLMEEHKVQLRIMNPKSITMGQLYGQFDPVSHEWKDGVLAKLFREAAVDTSPDRKWVLFDGPVDAVWIENMNTVLDDNKKLCLNSGEIIQMSASMNMIFEVQDLAVASPATVSRCGMVYVEPEQLGWRPLRDSWMHTLPPTLAEEARAHLNTLFEWLVDPCVAFIRKNCKELVPTADISLPNNLMSTLMSLMDELKDPKQAGAMAARDVLKQLDGMFVFSLIWSVGATTDTDGRTAFSDFLRKLLEGGVDRKMGRTDFDLGPGMEIMDPGFKLSTQLPKDGLVYDYVWDKPRAAWRHWMDSGDSAVAAIPESADFNQIIVPTVDTVRYTWLLTLLATHGRHVLFAGPTGTGKTAYVKSAIEALDKSLYTNQQTAFSAQTSANMIQDIIDARLDKRRKGIFGPPVGMRCVVFVDDVNMPALEVYGAQPPVELLRQFLDHSGWYDRADNTWRQLADMQLVCAMGPPGGGRNPVTPRFVRHFNLVAITEFDDATYTRIYGAICDWWFRRARLPEDVRGKGGSLVKATLEIYNTIRAQLLPTPAKSHYTYNMRDLSKVFQGVQSIGVPVPDARSLTRLWAHETLRVFHDRLVDDGDRTWYCTLLKDMVNKHLGLKFDNVFEPPAGSGLAKGDVAVLRNLLYCDFQVPGADPAKYDEVTDLPKLLTVVQDYLADYNAQSKNRMDLVLFLFAAEHICRISRIIKQPYGNALLVGVGGSGRQSLTRIATFMADYKLFTIEISKSYTVNEWREDLKRVLRQAGGAGQSTVFLFSDSQLKDESFLEDLNNILNTGEVPNLFAKDEVVGIMEQVTARAKRAGKPLTPASLFAFFVDACRANLHMVLAMSPVGGAFRERLRKFPSLVNCTTIDWFSVWPSDALKSVASKFLHDVEMTDDATRSAVEDMCMEFHVNVRALAVEFKQELGRHYYTTPTSYLELIQTYKELLASKRKQVHGLKRRYEVGLEKLLAAEQDVGAMKEELIALQPKLIETGKEVEETLKIVDKQTQEAEAKKVVVQGEEAVANEKAAAAKAIKDECEADLAVALPLLESALKALDTLTKADITEVKAMKNPPKAVKVVMEAVCQMLSIKPNKINDPANPSKKINDYWGPSQGLLADTKFLDTLRAYDKDNIPQPIIAAVRPYLDVEEFDPPVVKKASNAAYGLCCWVRAMESYDKVAKVVAPKKAKLAEAEAEFNELMVGLNAKKAELADLEAKLAELNTKLAEMQARKAQLEAEVDLCEKKLDRATKLIGGLGGEKSRWTEVAAKLGGDYINLTGDVLLASGFIAYLGAFTAAYRERATSSWVALCRERAIPCSEHFKLVTVLGEPVKIRDWTIDGLPNDSFSIDNGIIVSKARRWPLLIDPQGQANKWIKNMEKKHKLEVMKLSDGDYIRRLENCIQFGTPVLLENVGEELDPTLEPLLLKSVFKQGGGLCIRLGDATIEYSESFRFYMTTKLRNPHYLPEVSVKVTLLNFMITPEGLEDQLLGIVVRLERPELEEQKTKLVLAGAENARQLKEIEDRIIEVLSASEGNILEDETAINVISSSKLLSNDIAQKQQIADKTERTIDETRLGYKPVARHVSVLFFCISDLAAIEPMYQYSLLWFVNLFEDTIARAEKSKDLARRIEALISHFTYSLYINICRSLFEKDKLLFSFALTVSIRAHIKQQLDLSLFRFLLTGGIGTAEPPPNPSDWLADKCWSEMCRLAEHFEAFKALPDSFRDDPGPWRAMYDSADPTKFKLPEPWHSKLDGFQKLLIVRLVRPDKLVGAIQAYVLEVMGHKFIEPPPFDLDRCYQDSTCLTPLIFVLSPGSDPMSGLLKYADAMRVNVESISLGQGQGPKASKLIEAAQAAGGWVVLQNCHLAVSWMPTLERLCEGLTLENTAPAFRLWLTSYPSPSFPVSVLQNGIKMTNDPPKGLRANLLGSYLSDPVNDPAFFEGCNRPAPFKKLLFGLCFFHAFVQERLKFGPLGWNVPYQFSAPDFVISARQLQMFLNEMPAADPAAPVPLPALRYLTGECNYGGRVTDAHDRRTLMSILDIFYTPAALTEGYAFSPSGRYYAPPEGHAESYLAYIRGLPILADPEVFGLHANADITKDQQETDLMLSSLLAASSGGGGGGGAGAGRDALLAEVAADIMARVPQPFDIEAVRFKYPVDYFESMNTVLCQELVRFNRLLEVVHESLAGLQKALRGLVLMSGDLEALGNAMYDGRVPKLWMDKSYPSLKPLASYVADLIERCRLMSDWVEHGPPPVFWISGFYFTHAFLTGVKQNYARRKRIPIDTITFNYTCMEGHADDYKAAPEDGALISGMFVEGARWDPETAKLQESLPKVLFSPAPLIKLSPCDAADQATFPHYECPLYRTPERRGVLATTGHSTNFVMELMIPSDQPQDHWTRRGVAFLLSLAD